MKLIDFINGLTQDTDVYVDGLDGMAVCPPVRLTPEGREHFIDIFDMEVDGCLITGTDKDYDDLDKYEEEGEGDGGRLMLAYDFIKAQAGYCSCPDFDRWFAK